MTDARYAARCRTLYYADFHRWDEQDKARRVCHHHCMTRPGVPEGGMQANERGRSVFAFLGQHLVILASPYPADECGRRLAATGRSVFGSIGSRPLQGRVSPDVIRVARRQPFNGRNGLLAWFSGRIEQAPDGGTRVAGSTGPQPVSPVAFAGLSLVWLVVAGGIFSDGLSSLVSGHPDLPLLLIPMTFAAVYVAVLVTGPRMARNEIQQLLDELNTGRRGSAP